MLTFTQVMAEQPAHVRALKEFCARTCIQGDSSKSVRMNRATYRDAHVQNSIDGFLVAAIRLYAQRDPARQESHQSSSWTRRCPLHVLQHPSGQRGLGSPESDH
jgi:hypothetical protein